MALQNIYTLDVDFKKSSYINEPIVTQNDSVKFIVNVFNDDAPFDLSNVTTFTLASLRSDKQSVMSLGVKTATNQITFELGSSEVAKIGKVDAAIQLYDANGRLSTLPFTYQVIEDLIKDYVPSTNEKTLIELVLTEAPAIIENAREVTEEINTLNDTIKSNEADRQSNEQTRESAESFRKDKELDRTLNEIERQGEEDKRVTAELERVTKESERITAENQRVTDESTRQYNEQTRIENESSRLDTFNTKIEEVNQVVTDGNEMIASTTSVGAFSLGRAYKKNNLVLSNGSTWIALQDTTMNPLPTLPTTENTYWRLVAQRGVDGAGSVVSVNNITPDVNGNVTLDLGDSVTMVDGFSPNEIGNVVTHTNKAVLDALTDDSGQLKYNDKAVGSVTSVNGQTGDVIVQGFSGSYTDLTDKPTSFTPSAHTHTFAQVAGLQAELDAKETPTGTQAKVDAHANRTDNPHGVTASQVGAYTKAETDTVISDKIDILTGDIEDHNMRLNSIENGASTAKADVAGLNREVAYLKLQQDAKDRIEGGTVFADDFKGNRFGFTLDEVNSNGFKIKNGKLVMVKDEATDYNVTDATVVASAYSTAGNGGRKLVRLDNGWLVAAVIAAPQIHFYVSKDTANTWQKLSFIHVSGGSANVSISSKGTFVYVIFPAGVNGIASVSFDALTITKDENIGIYQKAVDLGQNAIGDVSLAIDPTNGHLHAAWTSKNATYPNSFNIRYSKSTDGGVTWSTVEQVSKYNSSGVDSVNPSIAIRLGNPYIITAFDYNTIRVVTPTGLETSTTYNWTLKNIHSVIQTQNNPSAVVDKDGVIHVAWHGTDATHTSTNYIRYSKSTDGGVNWSAMKKLVTGQNASITSNKDNHLFITYNSGGSMYFIKSTDGGVNWSNANPVSTGGNPSALDDKSLNFTVPLTVSMGASSVLFNGAWVALEEIPTLTATATYNIPSTDYVGAFVQKTGNVAVSAYANDELVEGELENNEYKFVNSLDTEEPVKLRLELSRSSTVNGENDAITRILGGRS